MDRRESVWIVVADARMARLLSPSSADPRHLRMIDEIHEQWDDKEHHRPQPLGSKSGHAYAAFRHEDEERLHRHAKRLEHWMGQHRAQNRGGRWTLVAPPRLLGQLRLAHGSGDIDGMNQIEAELSELSPTQLARHPALASVMNEA